MFEDGIGGIAVADILVDAFADFAEFGFGVIGFAEAEMNEIGRDDVRGFERFVFGLAKSHVPGAENLVDVFAEPAGVAEFEGVLAVFGKQADEFGEDFEVGFERGSKLKKNRAEAAGMAKGLE